IPGAFQTRECDAIMAILSLRIREPSFFDASKGFFGWWVHRAVCRIFSFLENSQQYGVKRGRLFNRLAADAPTSARREWRCCRAWSISALERNIVHQIVDEAGRFYANSAVQASQEANDASHVIKDQQGFVVVEHWIVVSEVSVV